MRPTRKHAVALFAFTVLSMLMSGCATRSDYSTYYLAEQGDYAAALAAARNAQGGGIDGIIFGTGASECRDYGAVVTVLVAQGDFAGASEACADYDSQCAVVPGNTLCFSYNVDALKAAAVDGELAGAMTGEAREALHYRWLMIRDDYEGRPIKRPIY
jgi:hypothetical protein